VEVTRRAKTHVDALLPSGVATEVLTRASGKFAEALAGLATGNMAAARTAYDAAVAAAEEARPAVAAAGGRLGATATADFGAPSVGADAPGAVIEAAIASVLPIAVGAGVNLAKVNCSLRRFAIGFAIAILVLAILSGLKVLYAPNPAFGCYDLLVAAPWGAGLHAVAGQAFQGLQGLAQQFR
jgi:hypothetical protein